jgi:hypothetical protein
VSQLPGDSHFDVFLVGGAVSLDQRTALLQKIEPLYPLDPADAAAFVAGGSRLRVRHGLDQDAAMKTLLALQQLGGHVELEAHRPAEVELTELDDLEEAAPPSVEPEAAALQSVDALRAALSSLDGVAEPEPEQPSALAAQPAASRKGSPEGLPTHDVASPPGPAPLIAAREPGAPPRTPPPSLAVCEDDRFRPPSLGEAGMELLLEVPQPKAAPSQLDEDRAEKVALCAEHDLPKPCQACAGEDRPIPGRLLQGRLRQQPFVRLGAGIALGLLVGYLASLPYANRAERRAAKVRAEADLDRYKNAPEALANAARLDTQAADLSSTGAIGTSVIWLLVGGGVVAGWYRAT